jgi:hypothetical protein
MVERRKAKSMWVDFLWRPVSVFVGSPPAAPWTALDTESEITWFYAGQAVIELYRTETTNYRDNLASGSPALWVALHPAATVRPYEILAEAVPMPAEVVEAIVQFLAEHHVERPFVKRRRQPPEQALARREGERGSDK